MCKPYSVKRSRLLKDQTGKALLLILGLAVCLALCTPVQAQQSGNEALSPPPLQFEAIQDQYMIEMLRQGINTHVIWSGSGKYKNVCLTFDDGPNSVYTPRILKILQENKVRATFFLIGQKAQKHTEMVKQICEAGHEIGAHTFSHVQLTKIPSEKIKQELETTRSIVEAATGEKIYLFRPPWGIFDGRSLAEIAIRKFDAVLWSVDSRDWSRPGVAQIKKTVIGKTKNGSIILCHDDHDQIVQALPEIIASLREQGYQFITVSEMMTLSMNTAANRP